MCLVSQSFNRFCFSRSLGLGILSLMLFIFMIWLFYFSSFALFVFFFLVFLFNIFLFVSFPSFTRWIISRLVHLDLVCWQAAVLSRLFESLQARWESTAI